MSNLSTGPEVVLPSRGTVPCCSPLISAELSTLDAERLANLFKALADPIRLRLLSRVASHPAGEACVCDIADVGVSQPTVSHHLKKLREAGLLTSQRRRSWVYYRVDPGVFVALASVLAMPARA
ncbi:helix-turn-helix transcriptional regulator [uncultured Streptomyces sp.]|uniref:ArsR/SmtB family transcription factor n=1 Tax=uncultured Streptomyces sp. TaxID=174707 RepID=UPI00261A4EA1|nr:metalloregulator ArsR/SmtB family transcription factor [uncultured Streptomyces sp.]